MTVRWEPRIWNRPYPATPQDVESLERTWGVKIPEDYKQVAMMHQGMTPYPHVIDIGTGNTVISELLTISESEDDDLRIYSMSETYELIKPHVPPGIYPFASTSAGDFICFDYRSSPDTPKVAFYFTEEAGEGAIHPVADSFTEFLSKLHD
jgi:cell wall assembly regulator SMI1